MDPDFCNMKSYGAIHYGNMMSHGPIHYGNTGVFKKIGQFLQGYRAMSMRDRDLKDARAH